MRGGGIIRAAALLCTLGGVWCSGAASAAEFEFHPSLAVSEEYNDNILDSSSDRKTDFVTRVSPGASLLYRSARVSVQGSYGFDYRHYARGGKGDEKVHFLTLQGNAALAENFLFLDLNDTLRRTSLDVSRDVTTESLFVNQTDENRAVISPYALWHVGETTVLKTGYRYTDVRYWSVAGDTTGIDRKEHEGYAELQHQPTARLSFSAANSYKKVQTELYDYDEDDLSGGFRYEYADKSFLFGGIGNSWQKIENGSRASNIFWNAGITHDFGLLVGTVEARVQYTDDPLSVSTKETRYGATVEKPLEKGSVGMGASYVEYRATLVTPGSSPNRDKFAVDGFGRFELSPRLSLGLGATGDKVTNDPLEDYPYHFSVSGNVAYRFNYDVTASVTYDHIEYRHQIGDPAGSRQTNRAIVEVKKVF